MSLGEFELIDRYFQPLENPSGSTRPDVALGIGDDGAIVRASSGDELVMVLDTVVVDRHFFADADPHAIAWRALAVNLSDLAAMGATPAWALLGLTLPEAQPAFLERLAQGWRDLATEHDVALIGGNTTRGPLSLTVQLTGFVPPGAALLRSGGAPGDRLFVSGTVGDAAAGLALRLQRLQVPDAAGRVLRQRLEYPAPRVALGLALRGVASACIDASDGLAADASRLAAASGCGLRIDTAALPLSPALRASCDAAAAVEFALQGGEDYELVFSCAPAREAEVAAAAAATGVAVTPIGWLESGPGLRLVSDGRVAAADPGGYDHFRS